MRISLFFIFSFCILRVFSQEFHISTQLELVDFKTISASIIIDPYQKKLEGEVTYQFDILKNADSIYIDAKNMQFQWVKLQDTEAKTRYDGDRLWIYSNFKASTSNSISLEYTTSPSQTMYFLNWDVPKQIDASRQVWTQGQGRYTSHWLPSFDDMNEKTIFDLSIVFPKDYKVSANGNLVTKKNINDSLIQWNYDMVEPMSNYLVAVVAGDFEVEEITSGSGVPIELYYESKDSLKLETTYRYTKEILDFFEEELGTPYPWQNYKQIPVQDFLHAGMENTGLTIFANMFMVDSVGYNDQNYVNVNAHELAHQWFGNSVTASHGKHHWLQEGLATYYALLAEKEIFGEDYFYWKLYQSAEQLKDLSDNGKGQALINEKASSLTYYQKGAWAVHILRELIGDEIFKKGIASYLNNYKYKNASSQDFLNAFENAGAGDLTTFRKDWLEQSAFKSTQALDALKKSKFITDYMHLISLRNSPFEQKKQVLEQIFTKSNNDYLGQEAVFQLHENYTKEAILLYKKAFNTQNLYVRQAIASSMQSIPDVLKLEYESLLNDPSYLTKEIALMNLWVNFPSEAEEYLEITDGVYGFNNYNVRLLWLGLNLVAPHTSSEEKNSSYQELSSYTAVHLPMELRQNTFGYLKQLNSFSNQNLKDLLQASTHFNHRFRSYSRELLDSLLEQPEYTQRFMELSLEIPQNHVELLNTKLKI